MGRVVSKTGALQLLLIIDYIAEWARETYRFDIICCLAGGRDRVLGADNMSETYGSRISTQSVTGRSPLIERQETTTTRLLSEDIIVIDQPTSVEAINPTTVSDEVHHFLRWAQGPDSQRFSSHIHTIRHTDMVLFTFVQLAIPEDRETLLNLLSHLAQRHSLPVQQISYSILSKLRDQGGGVLATTQLCIEQLKSEWLRLAPTKIATAEAGVRALFSVRTFLNWQYWQIERELLCISCKRGAAQHLASIAGFRAEELQVSTDWAVEAGYFPSVAFTDLRSITGRALVTAAICRRALYLVHASQGDTHQWVRHKDVDRLTKDCFKWCFDPQDRTIMRTQLDRVSSGPMEVLAKPVDERLKRLFRPMVQTGSAVLLNKVSHHDRNVSRPTWCLMIFKQVDFQDTRAVRDILHEVAAKGEFYAMRHGAPIRTPVELRHTDCDLESGNLDIEGWLQELST
jgi:hypothetical protein